MNQDILLFFDKHQAALPLYERFEERVLAEIPGVGIRVQKTQISFSNEHNFAFVSFLPVRRAKERPAVYLVVTFGLDHRVESLRIDAATEPYPNRWTHHVLISEPGEIDEELMAWVKEAAAFSAGKRRHGTYRCSSTWTFCSCRYKPVHGLPHLSLSRYGLSRHVQR